MTNRASATAPSRARLSRARHGRALTTVLAAVVLLALAKNVPGHVAQAGGLTDTEFWSVFSTMSEPGGTFASENFVSNEVTFQDVIPSVQRTITPGGVYLGVGPEQNYTYIANLRPRMAFIVDIRRQNAMQHLMFKALFELSPTRAEFVSRLFSRPFTLRDTSVAAQVLFDSADVRQSDAAAYRDNLTAIRDRLTKDRGFDLSLNDQESLEHVYQVFYEAGPAVNYGYRPGVASTLVRSRYPTFGDLQSATNADSVPMAFLATEENYGIIRDMHLQNRIVPVVGDFGGPTALRSVGDYLWQRGMVVTTFYLSNVEQYLFRERDKIRDFYGNVAALPTDSTSMFIRSVPPGGSTGAILMSPGTAIGRLGSGTMVGTRFSISIRDSGGVRMVQTIQDSAGVPVTRTYTDSAGRRSADSAMAGVLRLFTVFRDSIAGGAPAASARLPRYSVANLLTSGTASIRETVDRYLAGEIRSYQDIIAMTKVDGWQ